MSRGVECRAVTMNEAGNPVFLFQCDCGTPTAVEIVDVEMGELAYTCDGCQTSHWMTIEAIT